MSSTLPQDDRPRRPRSPGRRAALIAAGVVIAGLTLVVVITFDTGRTGADRPADEMDAIELAPAPLATDDVATRIFDPKSDAAMPVLDEGGSIQSVDEDGNLAQQYRFDRLDPNPPGMPPHWVQMERPRAEIYLGDDRVLTLEGDSALAHIPQRVLESGTMTGNVTIRLYQPPPGLVLDTTRDKPMLEVRSDEAMFDNVIGEIRCDGRFVIETPSLEFPGNSLAILIDDQREPPELSVEVAHVEFVRLVRSRPAAAPAAAATPQAAPAPAGTPAAGEPQYYRLTLHDQVRVQAGPEASGQTIAGDSLEIVFSSQSQAAGSGLGLSGRPAAGGFGLLALSTVTRMGGGLPPPAASGLAPPPSDDDVVVTCTGPLTMLSIPDPTGDEQLSSPRDALLRINGTPAELHDAQSEGRAACDHLLYRLGEERVDLVGSPRFPLTVNDPDFAGGGELFWIRGAEGGFDGPGWLESDQLRVSWENGLDLEFADDPDALGPGRLSLATFRGDVIAVDPDRTAWADRMVVTLNDAGDEVRTVTADGRVQVLLEGGTRAFADTLLGDGEGETVELTGTDVAIAHQEWLLDRGRRLVLSRRTDTARWFGAGRARAYDYEVASPAAMRLPRPRVVGHPQATVEWSRSLVFDNTSNEGAGAIDIVGDVRMVSEPQRLRRDTLDADAVTVDLARNEIDPAVDAATAEPQGRGLMPFATTRDPQSANRILARVTAQDDVKLESRTWRSGGRVEPPSIFYVAGSRLEYDQRSGEALIPGRGEMLIRDLSAEEDGAAAPLSGKGATSFRWHTRLHMSPAGGTVYDVVMVDGVEMRHAGPDDDLSTLACNTLNVAIDRPEPEAGPARLQRVRAVGGVFVRTPQRDVDCDELSYDVATGLAELIARPGRSARIYTRGMPEPTVLEGAVWDMHNDTVRARRGASGGSQ